MNFEEPLFWTANFLDSTATFFILNLCNTLNIDIFSGHYIYILIGLVYFISELPQVPLGVNGTPDDCNFKVIIVCEN